jgi:hypothetical protein
MSTMIYWFYIRQFRKQEFKRRQFQNLHIFMLLFLNV